MTAAGLLLALTLAAADATATAPAPGAPAASERLAETAARLRALLPPPLPGWTAEEPEEGSGLGALLGGPSASRRYRAERGAATVDVEVAADSPLADSLAPVLDDPSSLAGTPGSGVVDVQGRKALRRLDPGQRLAEVSLVVPPRTLVAVRALGVQGDGDALAYARALDLAAVERLLGP